MLNLLWPGLDCDLGLIEITDAPPHLDIHLALTAPTAPCPVCHTPSPAVHSHYPRTLSDLPVTDYSVRLRLLAHRFFCRVPDCPRRIFAEPLGALADPYAHCTTRLATSLRQIGLALGGRAGQRLAALLYLPASRDSLLRFVRLTPDSALPHSPRYLGVDDFCWRKGQTYGTILVDWESGRPIDLLPDRPLISFSPKNYNAQYN